MPKKAGNKWSPSSTARYSEGYGPMMPPPKNQNPGIGEVGRRKKVSDAIRGWGSHNSKTRYGN
jgi:hypothetical protein